MASPEEQWRADVLETLVAIQSYAQASAEAQLAALAALGEIRACLSIQVPGEAPADKPEDVTVAELLEGIASDLDEAGHAAKLLADDDDDASADDG